MVKTANKFKKIPTIMFKKDKGFTFIEVIIVIAMITVLSTVSINILITVLRGSLKSQVTKEVKQSGDYAINVMTRMIRNATSIEDCAGNSIHIRNPDAFETVFNCGTQISSASASINPTPVPELLTSSDLDIVPGTCLITCDLTKDPPIVTIDFSLSKNTSSFRAEEQIRIDFHTKVALRSY